MSLYLNSKKIIKEWTDYNGHMNVAYYVLIFDLFGAEILMDKFKMGEESAKKTKKSTMVVESHITYNQEVKEGDEVDVNLLYFELDKNERDSDDAFSRVDKLLTIALLSPTTIESV